MKHTVILIGALVLIVWIWIPTAHTVVENPEPKRTPQIVEPLPLIEVAEAEAPEPLIVAPEEEIIVKVLPPPPDGVYIDLNEMKMVIFKDKERYAYDILSKGNEDSTWRTPRGQFEALVKEESHWSTIGHVYMPYSIQFYGDFFMHGEPYYQDGTKVPRGFSGGCIRMYDEDMEEIYNLIDINMPITII
jgi:lipoprotein-anchoring transpeptidase ErfK/SrfK